MPYKLPLRDANDYHNYSSIHFCIQANRIFVPNLILPSFSTYPRTSTCTRPTTHDRNHLKHYYFRSSPLTFAASSANSVSTCANTPTSYVIQLSWRTATFDDVPHAQSRGELRSGIETHLVGWARDSIVPRPRWKMP